MNTPRISCCLLVLALLHASGLRSLASTPGEDMASAALTFLAALEPDQRAKASFDLGAEERFNWHFIPKDRKGLTIKEMAPDQKLLAHALLNSAMSNRGYLKAVTVMSLEQILHEIERGTGRFARDPELYYFSVFGKPDAKGTWAWRVEGHHLSLNFTVVKGTMTSVTPSFFGTNPGTVKVGHRKGLQVLAGEENIARKLVNSLTDEQKKVVIFSDTAPRDVITGADRRAHLLEPQGLAASKMSEGQVGLLKRLVQQYVQNYRQEFAEKDLEAIKSAGSENIFFAWAGSVEVGKGHYYRVQGPTFLFEYDNTQNSANHVHAVWRDLKNDFGEDLLKNHYQDAH